MDIVNIDTITKDIKEKVSYYNNLFKKYGLKKNALLAQNPISLEESKELFYNIQEDKELLSFLKTEIFLKLSKDGCIQFYNSLYFNLIPFLTYSLDIDNLKIEWDEEEITKSCLKILINKNYYGDLDIFNNLYSSANPKELKELADKSIELGNKYNTYNDKINELANLITNPPKKDLMHKLKIYKKDPLEKEKTEYDNLLEEKLLIFSDLVNIENRYKKIVESIMTNREYDNELNKLIKNNFNFEIIYNLKFPEIETYSDIEDRFELIKDYQAEEGAPLELVEVNFEFKSE